MRQFLYLLALCSLCWVSQAQNLIRNPEFREGVSLDGIPDGWVYDTPDMVKCKCAVVQEDGGPCFKITRLNMDGPICRISGVVDGVKPDAYYIASVEVKSVGKGGEVYLYDFGPGNKYDLHEVRINRNNHEWQTGVLAFRSSAQCRQMKISLMASKDDGPVFFRNVRLYCVDETPQVVLHELAETPALEADWDAPVWEQAEETTPFYLLGKEFKLSNSETSTVSRFGIANGALQVITYAKESDMAGRVVDKDAWNNDSMELFLRDPVTRICYHVGITATGEQCADVVNLDRLSGFAKDWYTAATTTATAEGVQTLHFQSAIAQRADGWVGQFAIPLDQQVLKGATKLQVLLTRGRKVRNVEEYSSWGRTTTTYFKDSDGFVSMALPVSLDEESKAAEVVFAQPPAEPSTLVVPKPQSACFGGRVVHWAQAVDFFASNEKAAAMAKRMLSAQLGISVVRSASAESARLSLELVDSLEDDAFAGLKPWQRQEAYLLEAGDKVRIVAESHRGLVNGLASFCQLADFDENGALAFQTAMLKDWPDQEYRGWHCLAPATEAEFPTTLRFIDAMAAMKFNWFSLQFDTRFRYERHPEMGSDKAPSKEQHKQIAALLDLYGIEVIPMTQCLSHFRDFLVRPALRRFAEVQNPPENAEVKYWNYCPRDPEIHQLVFDMIEEHLECYPKAKWYHVGMDEVTFEPFGVCDRCKDSTGGELFAEEVMRLYNFVTAKGLRMGMWCDQLEGERNGGKAPYNTVTALPKIPRDIVIFDWHYVEDAEPPSVKFFKDNGFDVIACGWYFPRDIMAMADEALRQNALGFGGTTWRLMSEIRDCSHLLTALTLGAERSWNANGPSLAEMPYIPQERFKMVFDGRNAQRPRTFRIVDLSALFNMSLSGNSRTSWMGLDEADDCSALPTGLQWFGGIPYRIGQNKLAAVATADASEAMRRYPTTVQGAPVAGLAKELCFLQTATRPPVVIRTLPDNFKEKPTCLGFYVVHYADGKTLRIPLDWEKNITQWNAQAPSAFCTPVWQTFTKGGAWLSLESFRWTNPRPEVPILSVDLESTHGKSAPVLLAITAVVE